jgi:two-component system chemotaxis sensor kinase CheA
MLDDFYAECDELLTSIRGGLTQLEEAMGRGQPASPVLEALFRNTHTLKGISGIVGLRAAEELAHGMEDLLRALSKHELQVTAANVDSLMKGVQRLEQIATSHRLSGELPDTRDLLSQFAAALGEAASAGPSIPSAEEEEMPVDRVAQARERGLGILRAKFTPSSSLEKRGINISSVRERLGGVGEIISASPSVGKDRSITFEFLVGISGPFPDISKWVDDGITGAPVAEDPPSPLQGTEGPGQGTGGLSITPSHIVRVDLGRLDDLMRITGEMVIQHSRLDDRIQRNGSSHSELREINQTLNRSLRELRAAIGRVRMVPISEIFSRMPFVIRDLERNSDKKVRVALEGNQTEIDKFVVERLKEPLLHLVRNAFAHGIEPAATRVKSGKSEVATVTLKARSAGESVVIQVRDDGAGINSADVVAKARKLGLHVPARMDSSGLLKVLCEPGFSTHDHADLAAGRGVGMSVVSNTVRELGGMLTLETRPGAGTEFTLKLPLSISIAPAIIVKVGGELCAVPQSLVNEVIQVPSGQCRLIPPAEVIPYRGGLLPIVRLAGIFRVPPAKVDLLTLLVIGTEEGSIGIVVDRILMQREIVVRPLADPLLKVAEFSGATELGDGRPILILNPNSLMGGIVRPAEEAMDRDALHAAQSS